MYRVIGEDNGLAGLKERAKAEIDRTAGQIRLKYITDIPGQELTYNEKAVEGKQYKADGYPPNVQDYPWVEADSITYGLSAQQAADNIIATYNQWRVIGVAIDKQRLSGKISIDNATTAQQVLLTEQSVKDALNLL